MIQHRCSCGHLAFFHSRSLPTGECSYGWCKHQGKHEWGPAEYVPSYDNETGRETPLVRPGTTLETGTFGYGRVELCDCPECLELYVELTGAAA